MAHFETEYSITPTIEAVDRDCADMTVAQLERHASMHDVERLLPWERLSEAQRTAQRAGNEFAKRQHAAARNAAKADADARFDAARTAAHQVTIEGYRQQVRGAWVGDQASFDAAWPALLQRWQIAQVSATLARTTETARARLG